MTLIGYLFWVLCLAAIIIAFFAEKKIGTTKPHKTEHQALNDEITRLSHSNDRPRF